MSPSRFSRTTLDLLVKADRPATPVFVRDGRFVAKAIMREAVKLARQAKPTGYAWTVRMGMALKHVWKRAKAAMAASLQVLAPIRQEVAPAPRAALAHVARRPARPAGWTNGARIYSNGW